jgi:hypothetical protein
MKTALLTAVGVAFVLAAPLSALADAPKAPDAKTAPAKPAKPAKPTAKSKTAHSPKKRRHGGGQETNDQPGVNKN